MLDRRFLAKLTTLGAIGLLSRATAAAEPAQWRIVTEYPATAMPGEGIATFAETATRLADGGLVVRPSFDAPDGLRSQAMLDAVSQGKVAAADAFTGPLAAEAPIFGLSTLPFLTASSADTARLLQIARPAYEAALTERGLVLLYATPWPASGIWSRTSLDGAAALHGLRIRTYDATSTEVLRRAGAAPVQVSFAEALPRFRSGELDAALSSGDGGAGARLWEVLPHFTVIDYASPLSLAFCSAAALAMVPAQVQAAVAEAGRQTEAHQFQAIATRLAENETRMRDNGVQIGRAPELREALQRAAGPAIDAWTAQAGEQGRAILAAYRQPG